MNLSPNVLARLQLLTKDHLTRHEAVLYSGVSMSTIDRRLADGTLPTVTTGVPKRVYIPRTALDLLVNPGARTDVRTKSPDKRRTPRGTRKPEQGDQPADP